MKRVMRATALGKKFTLMTTAFVLAVSSLTAVVPFVLSESANAAPLGDVVVKGSAPQGWTNTDTANGGAVNFVADGDAPYGTGALELTTNGSSSAKARYSLNVGKDLKDVKTGLSYNTKQIQSSFVAGAPAFQMEVCLTGLVFSYGGGFSYCLTGYTTLTYEPYIDQGNAAVHNGQWQQWTINSASSKFYSSRSYGSLEGSAGNPTYSLDQVVNDFPHARVMSVGVDVGSGAPNYTVRADGLRFDGVVYDFEPNVPTAPSNLRLEGTSTYTRRADGTYVVRDVSKNIELRWDAESDVTGAVTHATFPDGTTQDFYQGPPQGLTSLNPRDAGQKFAAHGQGAYTYTVQVNKNNVWSAVSAPVTVYYVSNIPTASFKTTPPQYVNGSFDVTVVAKDTVVLDSVDADVRDPSNNGAWVAGCTNGQLLGGATLPAYSNDGSGVTVEKQCTINTTNLVDGHTYTLRARAGFSKSEGGSHGNSNPEGVWTFTVDKSAPTVAISSASQPTRDSIEFTGDVQDANLNYYYCWLTAKGDSSEISGTRNSQCVTAWANGQTDMSGVLGGFDVTGLASGEYTIHLIAVDKATNHSAEATYDVTIDHTAPTVAISSVTRNTNGTYTITGTTDDNTSPVSVLIDGIALTPAATPQAGVWTLIATIPTGTHRVTAVSTDAAGNESVVASPYSVTVLATTPPALTTPPAGDTTNAPAAPNATSRTFPSAVGPAAGVLGDSTASSTSDPSGAKDVKGTSTEKTLADAISNTDGKAFGLAWYWWLLIVAALAAIIWWIVAAVRNRQTES